MLALARANGPSPDAMAKLQHYKVTSGTNAPVLGATGATLGLLVSIAAASGGCLCPGVLQVAVYSQPRGCADPL